jgi:hypothetical protein
MRDKMVTSGRNTTSRAIATAIMIGAPLLRAEPKPSPVPSAVQTTVHQNWEAAKNNLREQLGEPIVVIAGFAILCSGMVLIGSKLDEKLSRKISRETYHPSAHGWGGFFNNQHRYKP